MAKQGQMDTVKIMAKVRKEKIVSEFLKTQTRCLIILNHLLFLFPLVIQDLVRTRRYVKKFMLPAEAR